MAAPARSGRRLGLDLQPAVGHSGLGHDGQRNLECDGVSADRRGSDLVTAAGRQLPKRQPTGPGAGWGQVRGRRAINSAIVSAGRGASLAKGTDRSRLLGGLGLLIAVAPNTEAPAISQGGGPG